MSYSIVFYIKESQQHDMIWNRKRQEYSMNIMGSHAYSRKTKEGKKEKKKGVDNKKSKTSIF